MVRKAATKTGAKPKKAKAKVAKAAAAKPRQYHNIFKGRTRVEGPRSIRWVKEGAKDLVYNRKDMSKRTELRWAQEGAKKKQSRKMKAFHRAKKATEAAAPASVAA